MAITMKIFVTLVLFLGTRVEFSFQEYLDNFEDQHEDTSNFGDPNVPVDGNWGEWSPWGACSRSCGGGEHARTRVCNNPEPANEGRDCEGPFRQRERLCNNHKCPVDGMWGSWTSWTACSKTCGGSGTRVRKRHCNNPKPAYNGTYCVGLRSLEQFCNSPSPCPVDGMWGSWTSWTACSKTCGSGTRERRRFCDSPKPANNGTYCLGDRSETQKCNGSNPCPVDGMWSSWTRWTTCSKTCGTSGTRERKRLCDNPKPANNGTYCLGDGSQTQKCNAANPCPIDGMWGSWTSWTACSKTCGSGTRERKRFCDNPKPANNGTYCLGDGSQTQKCKAAKPCPIDGMWGSWSKWAACSKTCGYGTRYRKRFCNNPKPTYNGKICIGIAFQKSLCCVNYRCPVRRHCPKYMVLKCYYIRYRYKRKVCRCFRRYQWDQNEDYWQPSYEINGVQDI